MSNSINCIPEDIKLKITNNTNVDIPIEIMRLFPQGIDKTKLVQWDISGEAFSTNYVSLATTVPLVGYAKTLDINGVVDVLNSFKVATFFYVGTIIYAVNLLNSSVATADLTIGTGVTPPNFNIGTGFNNLVENIKVQSDGKLVVVGTFTTYNGTPANRIIRLNANGSIDGTFAYGIGFNATARAIAIQSDGKIIIAGDFISYNGTGANRIIRLNTDGSIDGTFVYGTGFNSFVREVELQADGKIVAIGDFGSYNATPTSAIVRLNTNGSVDGTFVYGSGFNIAPSDLVIQADGKIIVVGGFIVYDGTGANGIVRINTDGSIDGTFVYGTGFDSNATTISVQSDGKIIIGGNFADYNGTLAQNIIRLNTNGSVDGTFVYGTGLSSRTRTISIQTDGKIILGGDFISYNGTGANRIIRLNSDGSIDGTFVYGIGFSSSVFTSFINTDGSMYIGGLFTAYQATSYNYIIRLLTNGNSDTT